jgi:hypothetical protein
MLELVGIIIPGTVSPVWVDMKLKKISCHIAIDIDYLLGWANCGRIFMKMEPWIEPIWNGVKKDYSRIVCTICVALPHTFLLRVAWD